MHTQDLWLTFLSRGISAIYDPETKHCSRTNVSSKIQSITAHIHVELTALQNAARCEAHPVAVWEQRHLAQLE
jgi:hypothetical protein